MMLTASLLAVYLGLAVAAPPGLVPDAARGFMVWRSMQRGTPFNVIREPDPRDISRDTQWFMTWWTPGQYAVPAAFTAVHLNLGQAMLATVVLSVISGVLGGYVLFTTLGFGPATAAASVAIIVAWRYVGLAFRTYTGGEILLFGFLPWAVWLALKCRELRGRDVVALVALALAGTFLKSAFVVCALAIVISLALIRVLERRTTPVYLLKLAVGFLLPCAIYYVAFGRYGSTPAGLFAESKKGLYGLLFAVSTPLFAATSLSDVINRVFLFPGAPRVAAPEQLWPLFLVGAAVAIACYVEVLRRAPAAAYRGLILGFVATYVAVFGAMYLFGAAVGTDDRYFRPAAFLLVPGLVHAVVALRSAAARAVAFAAVGVLSLYGPASYVTHWPAHRHDPVGRLGFAHDDISVEALARLTALDCGPPSPPVFYLPSAALALEIQCGRAMSANPMFEDAATLAARAYRGRAGALVVALPTSLGGERTAAILSSFRDYSSAAWARQTSGDYVFYMQTAAAR